MRAFVRQFATNDEDTFDIAISFANSSQDALPADESALLSFGLTPADLQAMSSVAKTASSKPGLFSAPPFTAPPARSEPPAAVPARRLTPPAPGADYRSLTTFYLSSRSAQHHRLPARRPSTIRPTRCILLLCHRKKLRTPCSLDLLSTRHFDRRKPPHGGGFPKPAFTEFASAK